MLNLARAVLEDLLFQGGTITRVRKNHYDLLLLDCHMPEIDGFRAAAEIRAREAQTGASERLPIVALTAGVQADERRRCLDAGMDEVLEKPVTAEALAELVVRRALTARRPAVGL